MNNYIDIKRELISCPICQKNDYEILLERNQKIFTQLGIFSFEITDGICRGCGFIYQNPRPTQKELDNYYKSKFLHSLGSPDYDISARKKAFNKIIKTPSKVYEIGAGEGQFLLELESLGHKVYGYEPSANTIKPKFALRKLDPPYDVILSNHVMEHVADLKDFINDIIAKIKLGGIIYFEIPNIHNYNSSTWSIYHEHLLHFSPQSLIYLLNQYGFQTIDLEFQNVTRNIGFGIFAKYSGKKIPMSIPAEYIINKSYIMPCIESLKKRKSLQKDQFDKIFLETDNNIVLWGANIFTLDLLSMLNRNDLDRIIIVDKSNEKNTNSIFKELFIPIIHPKELQISSKTTFLICAVNWAEEIKNDIKALGFSNNNVEVLSI